MDTTQHLGPMVASSYTELGAILFVSPTNGEGDVK